MPSDGGLVRFGVFEVNLATGEIRRNGAKVRIQEQPFQVLAALLEKPGEIVAKEELQERIWKDATFVDFDRSLATAVNKVRQALDDSATRPRYIETIPKRGYRFIGLAAGQPPAQGEKKETGLLWKIIAAAALVVAAGAWWLAIRDGGSGTVEWSEPRRLTADEGLTFQPTISRDGTLIAYASDRAGEGNLDIWVQQTAGGEPHRVTDDPADDTYPHFSPDGQSIAFRSERGEGGVYVVPALGGFARSIAPRGHRPRFSPDGQWIAYFTAPSSTASSLAPLPAGELHVSPTSGGEPQRLAADALYESFPVWSPDGESLLVLADQSVFGRTVGDLDWRTISLEGVDRGAAGALAPIQDTPAAGGRGVPYHWDSDGFVYFSSRDADSANFWRIEVNSESGRVTGDPELVLGGPGAFRDVSMSADGRLVFAGVTENRDVWSLEIDANRGEAIALEPTRLTTSPADDGYAYVSEDGSRLVFLSNRSGKQEVWLLEVGSGLERSLGEGDGLLVNAAGDRVALRQATGLSILSLDGSLERHLEGWFGVMWGWSPDEAQLLTGRLDGAHRPIFLLDLESGRETPLLSDPNVSFFQGRFSPDGQWIAWLTMRGVSVARFRGHQSIPESERIRVSEEGPFADKPRWSPDGNLMYHTSDRDGFTCIYAQPLDPATKQPSGELLEIYHSHGVRRSIANVGMPRLRIDVARDKVVFGMAELTGNVWMMEPVAP